MRANESPATAGWMRGWALALALAALAPAAAGAAAWRPEVTGSFGGTFAVLGEPGGGGPSVDVGLLWPVDHGLSFGLGVLADDLGQLEGRLLDPHDGTDLGAVGQQHRWTLGAVWRADLRLPAAVTEQVPIMAALHLEPFVSGTWGYYRIADDVRGTRLGETGSTGFSLGGGLRTPVGRSLSVGVTGRYHRLFNDRAGRYVSVGLDWSWR